MQLLKVHLYLALSLFLKLAIGFTFAQENEEQTVKTNSIGKNILVPAENLLRSKIIGRLGQGAFSSNKNYMDNEEDSEERVEVQQQLQNTYEESSNETNNTEFSNPVNEEESKEEEIPSKCKKEKFEIKTPGDLVAISDCSVIEGNLMVADYEQPFLDLGDIKSVRGDVSVTKSPELVRIEAPKLASISNYFSLKELTSLSLISFPSLRSVKVLDWKVLPILSNVHFSNEIKDIESITVSDTSLTGFSGFMADKLETLDINNNRFLDTINCNVERITEKLHIAANAVEVIVSLPKLKTANNMSIHEVSDIDLGSLEEIDNSASIINNNFASLKIPKLKNIGGTLSLLKNEKLANIEFPSVTEIGGGLMVVNNTQIEKINFLPKLNVIGGAIEIIGNIKEATLKQLKLVKGSAKLKSYVSSFDCNKWSRSEIRTVIRGGKIECTNSNNEKIVSNTPTEGEDISENKSQFDTSDHPFSLKYRSSAPKLMDFKLLSMVLSSLISLSSI